jgi:hypothetical protein
MEEIWKTIEGFEDYEVSNFGRVKSFKLGKEKILKPSVNNHGYCLVFLFKDKKRSTKKIHQLVSIAFLNHTPCGFKLVVNHKDFNRENNHVDNLEIVTTRENTNQKHLKSSSQYTGVCWDISNNRWRVRIRINNKNKHLGLFTNEIEASKAYQNKLKEILCK